MLILKEVGFEFISIQGVNNSSETTYKLEEQFIPREVFLNDEKYNKIRDKILELKYIISSSYNTCLHVNAKQKQRFPLLNLVRQILHVYGYDMVPIRKSNGYTKDGIKLYKRFFQVEKKKILVAPEQESEDNSICIK